MDFIIHSLPIIKNCLKLDKKVANFKLIEGKSAETSGGLLLALKKKYVKDFV